MSITPAQVRAECRNAVQETETAWYSHSGNETISARIPLAFNYISKSFSRQQSQLDAILDNQKKIMAHHGISGYNPGTWQV